MPDSSWEEVVAVAMEAAVAGPAAAAVAMEADTLAVVMVVVGPAVALAREATEVGPAVVWEVDTLAVDTEAGPAVEAVDTEVDMEVVMEVARSSKSSR